MKRFFVLGIIWTVLGMSYAGGSLTSINFDFSPKGVRLSSVYTLSFLTSSSIPSTAVIKITLPNECTVATSSGFSCTLTNPKGSSSSAYCTSDSASNIVTVNNFFSSGSVEEGFNFPFEVKLNEVFNPKSDKPTGSISISVTTSSGSVIDSDNTSSETIITASPATVASVAIASSNQIVGAAANFTFILTPTYNVPAGSVLQVKFPYWNSAMSPSSNVNMITSSSPVCIGNSNIASSLSCTYLSSSQMLKVSGGFTLGVSGAVSFTVWSGINPPNPNTLPGFIVYLRDSDDYNYEISGSYSLKVSSPNTISISDSNIQASSKTVSTLINLDLTFNVKNPMASGFLIDITIPTSFSFDSSMTVIGKNGINKGTLTRTVTSNKLRITNGYSSYSSSTLIWVQLTSITTPSSTKPTGTFEISTLTADGETIDTGIGGTFTANPGTLTKNNGNPYITADTYTVGLATTYYFEFMISHSLPSAAAITIVFPSTVSTTSRSAGMCSSYITNLNILATCAVTGQVLTVLSGFTSGLTSGSAVKFGLNQVKNPNSSAPSSSFTFTTFTDSTLTYQIDTLSSGIIFTALPATLSSVTVTPTSDLVGETTTFTFTLITTTTIPTGGYIFASFPTGVTVADTASASESCTKITGFNSGTFNCNVNSTSIIITSAFASGSFSAGTLAFALGYMNNPASTKSIQSFVVSSFDSAGYAIDKLSTGISIKVNTLNSLASVNLSVSGLVNGALSSYAFEIIPKNTIPAQCIVLITPPASVSLPSVPTCSGISSGIASIVCVLDTNGNLKISLALSSPITASSSLKFLVNNVKNPPTTQPSASFSLSTFTSDNFGIDTKASGITVTTTTPGAISTIYITASNRKISASTSYTINYVPINLHPAGTVLTITVPIELTVSSITCTSLVPLGLSCLSSSNIVITSSFATPVSNSENVLITLSGLTNPSYLLTTSTWSIVSKTGDYLIDSSTSVTSTFSCTSPCLTCNISPSYCTSCLTTSSYPYLYSNTCNINCPDGQVDDTSTSDVVCVACNTICKTCSGEPSICSSCNSGSYPYLYSSTCNSNCPNGKYGDGSACYSCANPCNTCSSSTICLSCTIKNSSPDSGSITYLTGNSCVVNCPTGYVGNITTLVCDKCSSNCYTCVGGTSFCTSCSSGLYLLDISCVSQCPTDGTYVVASNICYKCKSPCETCSVTTQNCASCLTGYSLLNSYCLSKCPSGYTSINSQCMACKSPCATCSNSPALCLTCITNYVLFSTTCLDTCPDGYISDGVSCELCNSNCFTCSLASNICTSCTNGLLLLNTKCVSSCGSEQYVAISSKCQLCQSPCATCSGTTTFCKTCISTYKLYSNQCISSCPVGVTIDNGSSCSDCNSNCATCITSINICKTCASGKYLENNSCVDSCAGGSISINGLCKTCDPVCFNCEKNTKYCTSCVTGYKLYDNYCYLSCPENFEESGGKCIEIENNDCNYGCTEGMLNNDDCNQECNVVACEYDKGLCIGPTSCLDGQYQVDNKCYNCLDPCNKCTAPNTCLTCTVDSSGAQWLFYEQDSYCYKTCPTGTYKKGIECLDCSSECETCISSNKTCLSCATGYFLYNTQCIQKCPDYITVQGSNSCIDCDSNCKYCSGAIKNCTACDSGKVLQNNACKPVCDTGYIVLGSDIQCQACIGCLTCSGTLSNCISCTGSKYLYLNTCIDACPDGTFPNGQQCKQCDSTCVTCVTAGSCSTCVEGRVKFYSLCLTSCPSGYEFINSQCSEILPAAECATGCTSSFLNNDVCEQVCNLASCNYDNLNCEIMVSECAAGKYFNGTSCVNCVYPCLTCSSMNTCLTCAFDSGASLYLYNNYCFKTCPTKTMLSGIICKDCDSRCSKCAGSVSTCTGCYNGYYLYQGTCIVSCPALVTVAYGSVCEGCSSNCKTCSGSIDNCSACESPKYLQNSVCVSSCSSGYTLTSSISTTCQICTDNCAACSGETYFCLSCVTGLYLYNNQCTSTCPSKLTVINGKTCQNCKSPCQECSIISTNCTLCVSNYSLYNSQCLASCPSGYESVNSKCQPYCSDNCSSNNLLDSTCQAACNTVECNYDNGLCSQPTICDTFQYQDSSKCKDCQYPCNTCSSGTYCLSCRASKVTLNQLYYYQGKCYDTCPNGTFLSGIACFPCISDCKTCSYSNSTCTGCADSSKLYKNSCITSCPIGTTIELSGTCYDCSNNCAQCIGSTSFCSKCPSGLFISSGTCISSCASGYITSSDSDGSCVKCSSTCTTCIGSISFCTSCPDKSYLFENTCVPDCPSGYNYTLADSSICSKCISNCVECMEFSFKCTKCPTGYKLVSGSCVTNIVTGCPSGYTYITDDKENCYPCELPCLTCSGNTVKCTSCFSPLLLSNNACVTCTSPCQTCSNFPTFCTSCIEGYYLSGTTCIKCSSLCQTCFGNSVSCTSCQSGYALMSSNCLKCESPCYTCSLQPNNCTSCIQNKFLQDFKCNGCDGTCLTCEGSATRCTSCLSNYFLTTSNTCTQCSTGCKTCSLDSTYCTSCNPGKLLIDSTCGNCDSSCASCSQGFSICDSCATDKILISGACGVCSSNCTSCTESFNTCGSCKDGYYLSSGVCYKCENNCKTCLGSKVTCLTCASPYNLFESTCGLCKYPCKTCSGSAEVCLSCETTFNLIGHQCLQCEGPCKSCSGSPTTCLSCENGYFLTMNSCFPCDSNCLTCEQNKFNCLSCAEGGDLASGTCYYSCAESYTVQGAECVLCDPNCKTCAGEIDKCTSCDSSILFNNTCIVECPAGYYLSGSICKACSGICDTCGKTPIDCLSCNTGFVLVDNTCELICPVGEFYYLGTCFPCSTNCFTCAENANICLSCKEEIQNINALGKCEDPCESGFIRNSYTGECDQCSESCKECAGSTNYCSTCNDTLQFLYDGGCYDQCPALITVPINQACVKCENSCKTCAVNKEFCLSCAAGKYLHNNLCLAVCPVGFLPEYENCVKCETPDCGPISSSSNASSGSNGSNASEIQNSTIDATVSNQLSPSPIPFPFTGATVGTAALVGVSKLTATGVNFIPSIVSIWGATAAGSWIFLATYMPNKGISQHSRRLDSRVLNILDGEEDIILGIVIYIIFFALLFHFTCNFLYTTEFILKVKKNDKKFSAWRNQHSFSFAIIVFFSFLISFHIIRILYSGMCALGCFKIQLDKTSAIKRGLIKYGYVSILCTHIPMIAAQVLLINHLSKGYWIWMFTLDSLIITAIITLLIFYDIRTIEKDLIRSKFHLDSFEDDGIKLISEPQEIRRFLHKGISKSFEKLPILLSSPSGSLSSARVKVLNRTRSFPLIDEKMVKVDIQGLRFIKKTLDEPQPEIILENNLNMLDDTLIEDTIIQESFIESLVTEQPTFIKQEPVFEIISFEKPELDSKIEEETTKYGEFFCEFKEIKTPLTRPLTLKFIPFTVEQRTEEFTEIVAFTESDSEGSSIVLEPDFQELSQYTQQILLTGSDEHLGTIMEEAELEFEKAIADVDEPDYVTVPHLETGRRVKLKKDFQGARIVDLENQVIENLPPVNTDLFDLVKTVVDESDVRFAVLTGKNGQKVRVKRNFKGARILDLEKRTTSPFSFLIGKSVHNEQEFKFETGYPDPEDPEIVVVIHKETGEGVKVRKTFQDALIIDDHGKIVPEALKIDRSEYDIPKTIIDSEDIHIATLSHKHTKAKVRVRRDFKGAKIVDLEKRSERDRGLQRSEFSIEEIESSEPEHLSIDLSELEFPDTIQRSIKKPHRSPRPMISPGRQRLQELAKIINEESKITDYVIKHSAGIDSSNEFEFNQEPQIPHYRDLDEEFDEEFKPVNESEFSEDFDFLEFDFGKANKRSDRKRSRKIEDPDDPRARQLGDVYLEVQGINKRFGGFRASEDLGRLVEDATRSSNERQGSRFRAASLGRAAEQIVKGRTKKPNY